MIIVGPRENVFHNLLPDSQIFATWNKAFALGELRGSGASSNRVCGLVVSVYSSACGRWRSLAWRTGSM